MNKFVSLVGALAIGCGRVSLSQRLVVRRSPTSMFARTCNALQRVPEALSVDTGQTDAIKHCLDAEQEAHTQLTKEWTKFSPADRNLCVGESKSGGMAPAYSELETCLQMTRDARQLNSQPTDEISGQRREAMPVSGSGPTAQNQ